MDRIEDYNVNSDRWFSLEDFDGEVWKDIREYEGHYQVSNCGRIKSLERYVKKSDGKKMLVRERICKPFKNRGYLYVTLSKDDIQPNKKIHRLVAEAFLPNPHNLPDVNHKDEVLSNNILSNMEWCTKEYNRYYGSGLKRMRETWRKKYGTSILRLNLDGSLSKRYKCSKDLIDDGFDRRAVYRCCKDNWRTHHNYRWEFA